MKLLYTVILLLGLVQLNRAELDYDEKMKLFASRHVAKIKYIGEQLSEEPIVKQAATPSMQKFKTDISYFLQLHPFYVRHGLNETLKGIFYRILLEFSETAAQKDVKHIGNILSKLGYNDE